MRALPPEARNRVGTELRYVQLGDMPSDWKPMAAVGAGVQEIRVKVGNQYRVVYVAKFAESVYVLHVFMKKTQRMAKVDIELGSKRYRDLLVERRRQ